MPDHVIRDLAVESTSLGMRLDEARIASRRELASAFEHHKKLLHDVLTLAAPEVSGARRQWQEAAARFLHQMYAAHPGRSGRWFSAILGEPAGHIFASNRTDPVRFLWVDDDGRDRWEKSLLQLPEQQQANVDWDWEPAAYWAQPEFAEAVLKNVGQYVEHDETPQHRALLAATVQFLDASKQLVGLERQLLEHTDIRHALSDIVQSTAASAAYHKKRQDLANFYNDQLPDEWGKAEEAGINVLSLDEVHDPVHLPLTPEASADLSRYLGDHETQIRFMLKVKERLAQVLGAMNPPAPEAGQNDTAAPAPDMP